MELIFAGLGGIFGSILRGFISERYNKNIGFPKGTFISNIAGSFLLGLFSVLITGTGIKVFMLIGILGSLTTFSSFILEGFSILREKRRKDFLIYISSSMAGGIFVFYIGLSLGRVLI